MRTFSCIFWKMCTFSEKCAHFCLPLAVRLSTDEAAHATAQVTQRSEPALTQYKPQLCTFPTHYCTRPAKIIKAEPTAHNNTTPACLFVPRHGGSGEPALCVEKRRISHKGKIRSIQCCSVSKRIGAATGKFLVHQPGSLTAQTQSRKRSQDSSRGLWILRNQTPKDLREYMFQVTRCWS